MCTSAFDTDKGRHIDTVGQMADLVGGAENMSLHDGCGDVGGTANECLCSVNIADTLVRSGFTVWQESDDDPMMYRFARRPA